MFGSSAFNQSTTGGFNTPNSVDTLGDKEKGTRRSQSVVPICVRQVRDCPEEEFNLFGMKTQILTIVGILRDHEITSTKATYQIEDHTGTITAVYWLDNDQSTAGQLPPVKEGQYVRVYGSLRTTDDVKTLLVLKMFPVTNINEITTHLLEVIHVRLATENMIKGSATISKIVRNNPGAELANSMSFLESDTNYGNTENGFTPIQKKVFGILQCVDDEVSGMSRKEVSSKFRPEQKSEINDVIEFLVSEGHIYSTIDNDHFKAT